MKDPLHPKNRDRRIGGRELDVLRNRDSYVPARVLFPVLEQYVANVMVVAALYRH